MSGEQAKEGAATEVAPEAAAPVVKERHPAHDVYRKRHDGCRTRGRKAAREAFKLAYEEGAKDTSAAKFTKGVYAALNENLEFTFTEYFAHSTAVISMFCDVSDRLDALEAQTKEFRYCGVWQRAAEYRRGNFVTHEGSVWHCNKATTTKPGTSEDWQLAVKAGRDAR